MCSKLTIKTPLTIKPLATFWCPCELWTYFTPCYTAIANFEQVNVDWDEIFVEK